MGLMDILNGMSNGPHGKPVPPTGQGSGGMSPVTMGLLALLAYRAYKSGTLGGLLGQNKSNPASVNAGAGSASAGGLGDWLRDAMGGAAGAGSAGPVINGGLSELMKRFQQNGFGNVADSWVGTGPNSSITPGDLAKAAGAEDLDALAKEMGVPRDQLLAKLSSELPGHVDMLTPAGRLPEEQEKDEEEEDEDDDKKDSPRR